MNHHILSESFCFMHKLSSEIQLPASHDNRISLENRSFRFIFSKILFVDNDTYFTSTLAPMRTSLLMSILTQVPFTNVSRLF